MFEMVAFFLFATFWLMSFWMLMEFDPLPESTPPLFLLAYAVMWCIVFPAVVFLCTKAYPEIFCPLFNWCD